MHEHTILNAVRKRKKQEKCSKRKTKETEIFYRLQEKTSPTHNTCIFRDLFALGQYMYTKMTITNCPPSQKSLLRQTNSKQSKMDPLKR